MPYFVGPLTHTPSSAEASLTALAHLWGPSGGVQHTERALSRGAPRPFALKRRRRSDMEATAPTAEPEAEREAGGPEGGGGGLHDTCLARAGELEARLAAAEAASSELRGRLAATEAALAYARDQAELAALGGGFSRLSRAVEKGRARRTAHFLERRRDFGAELPPGVLLHIMDRAPDRKCVCVGIYLGGRACFKGGEPYLRPPVAQRRLICPSPGSPTWL